MGRQEGREKEGRKRERKQGSRETRKEDKPVQQFRIVRS